MRGKIRRWALVGPGIAQWIKQLPEKRKIRGTSPGLYVPEIVGLNNLGGIGFGCPRRHWVYMAPETLGL
ncbi:hypothetical protein M0804_003132 [Polistes exclamans]|nr:hypothetical protein M0804_003132 [Polistes exclamans]